MVEEISMGPIEKQCHLEVKVKVRVRQRERDKERK
jgi:hypothetical protein